MTRKQRLNRDLEVFFFIDNGEGFCNHYLLTESVKQKWTSKQMECTCKHSKLNTKSKLLMTGLALNKIKQINKETPVTPPSKATGKRSLFYTFIHYVCLSFCLSFISSDKTDFREVASRPTRLKAYKIRHESG